MAYTLISVAPSPILFVETVSLRGTLRSRNEPLFGDEDRCLIALRTSMLNLNGRGPQLCWSPFQTANCRLLHCITYGEELRESRHHTLRYVDSLFPVGLLNRFNYVG